MKISVIISFLLCWSFVSSNLYREKLNDKSVNGLNNINDASDILNLEKRELPDEASSGKDWGGKILSFLSFLHQKDLTDASNQANHTSFLDTLFSQGSKFIEHLTSKDNLSHIPIFGDIIKWVQKHIEMLGEIFTDEKTKKLNDRAKRDLETSTLELPWAKPHKGGISEHLLKLSEGSRSNVLKSEKATVAEALNGRTAIRKILARAKAKAAKAARHRDLFDNNEFTKWFLSESAFNTDIFNRPFYRPSHNAEITRRPEAEDIDSPDRNSFSVLRQASTPANRHHRHETRHEFNALSESAAVDATVTGRKAYAKLLHKPEYQEDLSSKLQITSGEEYGRETNGMFHKPAVSPRTHGSLSHEDEANTGSPRHASSHAYAPHMRFRATEDEATGNVVPKWRHVKWTYADDPSNEHTPRIPYFTKSDELDTTDEMEEYKKRFMFETLFGETDEEREDEEGHGEKYRKNYKFSGVDTNDEIYLEDLDDEDLMAMFKWYERAKLERERYYGVGNRKYYDENLDDTRNRHLTDEPLEYGSSINSHRWRNIGRKNKFDGIQHSNVYFALKSNEETEGAVGEKQSGDMLMTEISAGTPTRKPMNIDIERYHTSDRSIAANEATSFSSSLSDEKGRKYTNNALALASADDGSVAFKMKTENDGVLERTRTVIDNDATSAEIEMGFSEIKSHPPADLPLAHSSPAHAHSKMHLGNEKVHHGINGYQRSTVASSEMTVDTETSRQTRNKYLNRNQIITVDDASTEATKSLGENQRQYDSLGTVSLDDSSEEDYTKAREELPNPRGMDQWRNAARRKKIEVIDIDDHSAEVLIPQVHKFGKGHVLRGVDFYDLNDPKIRDDQIIEANESVGGLKRSEINYDNTGEKEEKKEERKEKQEERVMDIAIDSGVSEESNMIINEHGFHARRNQYRKSNKHDQHNRHHSERDYHKHQSQRNIAHNRYTQYNRYAFNRYMRDIMSSSTVSDATKYEIWKKYIYFLRERVRENGNSNASFESLASLIEKIREKQYNTMNNGEISSLNREEGKRITDEDNYVYLEKYKNIRDPVAFSMEINKVKSTRNNGEEREIKSEDNIDNQSKNHETIMHTGNLISDGSKIDPTSFTSRSEKTSDDNKHRKQISMHAVSLKNSRADIQTDTERRVYGAHGRNENVDVDTKQSAETMRSTDSENNLQRASWKTFISEMDKQIIDQTSNENTFSSSAMNKNHNDLQNTLASTKSTVKSEIQTKHYSNEKSKSRHDINTNIETLTGTDLSSDAMIKSRSNIHNTHNAIASSESSDELQIGIQHDSNNLERNKNFKTNAEAFADATNYINVENKRKSTSENALSFSRLAAKSKIEAENYSDNSRNSWMSGISSGASSGAVTKSFVESKMKVKKKSDNFENIKINTNAETSSRAMSDNERYDKTSKSSEESEISYDFINRENSRTNAISKASAEAILSNIKKDPSNLQKSLSSSFAISSEKLQAQSENNSNNFKNSRTSFSAAESSDESTSFDDTENEFVSDLSSSKFASERTHITNKQYSDDMKINRRENIGVTTNMEAASLGNVKNYHRQESESPSSSSHVKSQVENKNIQTSISTFNNVINNMNQYNLLHTLSSQKASRQNLNFEKHDPQIANNVVTSTTSSHINHNNHGHRNNVLKTKWHADSMNEENIERSESNESTEKSEFIKQDLRDTSSAATSIEMATSDIKNMMSVSSLKNSKFDTRIRDKHYLNYLKEKKPIIDDSITGMSNKVEDTYKNNEILETSFLSGTHKVLEENKKNHVDIVQNNRESIATAASSESTDYTNNRKSQKELKEGTLSASFAGTREKQNNLNVPREKSESTINKTAMDTISNNVNNIYRNDLLKDTLPMLNDKINVKLDDEIKTNAADSIVKNEVDSKTCTKGAKSENNLNEMMSVNLNSFNNEKQDNILKVTSSDDSYAEMSRENKHLCNSFSNANEISNVNVQNKDPYETISSVDAKAQSMIYHKPDILKKKKINADIHNNVNEWRRKFHATESSSLHAESRGKENHAMRAIVSAESIADNINEDIHHYDLTQDKFLSVPANMARTDDSGNEKVGAKEDNTKASLSAETSSSSVSQIKYKYDTKEKAFVASQLQQHDLNVQEKDNAITTNTQLSTEGTNFSEMQNARQELLERVTSSNLRTEMQHERIRDIIKESSEVSASAVTSAQAMSSGKVRSESEEELIKDSAESDSYAKSQMISNIDSNIFKKGKIIEGTETSANSASVSSHLENIRRNKLAGKNSLFDPGDTHTENHNRNVPINNFANAAADATVSALETSSNIIRGKHRSDATRTASNSHTEAQTEREYNSDLERQSMTSFADVKDREESKNIVSKMQDNLKATVTFANTMSSSSIENINKHNAARMLSSSDSYIESQNKIDTRTENFAENKESTIAQSSETSSESLVSDKKRKDNFIKEILQSNFQKQRTTKLNCNGNILKKYLHDSKDTVGSEEMTNFDIVENEHQDDLLKTASLQTDESNSFKNQHLITADSMASSNSQISARVNNIDQNNSNELTTISSSNSKAKSCVRNRNDVNVLKTDRTDVLSASTSAQAIANEFEDTRDKSFQITSSDSYAENKIESTDRVKENSDTIVNSKTETTISNDIRDVGMHGLLTNHATKIQTERKRISQGGVIKENISKALSDLLSKTRIHNAHNLKILEENSENSAMIKPMIKTKCSNQRDQEKHLHRTKCSKTRHNERNEASANYVTSQATNKDAAKSEKVKEEITVNSSTSRRAKAHNEAKGAHLYDWLVTSDANLAEVRIQNKNKFNILGETEEVAVRAGTSAGAGAFNGIESKHHDIHAVDPSDCQNSWNTAKNIQDAIGVSSTSAKTTACEETKNKSVRKNILNDKTTTLADDAFAEILINDREKCSMSRNSEFSANTKEMYSSTSAMSSASSSTSDNANVDLKKIYTRIDEKISSTSAISPTLKDNTAGEKYLETSLLPPDEINRCDENVETKEFISEVSSLYKMLGEERNSEILLMKRNPKGPVQIASLKNSVPPLIAYRLVPREVYDKIRKIIANKQIFCTDCPLSNN